VFQFGQPRYLNTAVIRNNVMLDVTGSSYLNYNSVDYGFSSLNSWDSLKGGNIQADPLFRSVQTAWYNAPNNYDFTLQPGSPAIGLGIPAVAPPADLLQMNRGATPDAGAYQYAATQALKIVTSALPNAAVGLSYLQALVAAGGTPPYTWALVSGSLPAGLTLSTSGVVSGTPTAAASPAFTVRVTDSASNTATANVTIAISPVSLASVTCAPSRLSSRESICTVALSGPAPPGVTIALSAQATSLSMPASVTIPPGAVSVNFTVVAGSVGADQNTTVIATFNGVSKSAPLVFASRGVRGL
jgi:hypothetical protein